jgi:hypothetical protein
MASTKKKTVQEVYKEKGRSREEVGGIDFKIVLKGKGDRDG